jgi:hypothetical protein
MSQSDVRYLQPQYLRPARISELARRIDVEGRLLLQVFADLGADPLPFPERIDGATQWEADRTASVIVDRMSRLPGAEGDRLVAHSAAVVDALVQPEAAPFVTWSVIRAQSALDADRKGRADDRASQVGAPFVDVGRADLAFPVDDPLGIRVVLRPPHERMQSLYKANGLSNVQRAVWLTAFADEEQLLVRGGLGRVGVFGSGLVKRLADRWNAIFDAHEQFGINPFSAGIEPLALEELLHKGGALIADSFTGSMLRTGIAQSFDVAATDALVRMEHRRELATQYRGTAAAVLDLQRDVAATALRKAGLSFVVVHDGATGTVDRPLLSIAVPANAHTAESLATAQKIPELREREVPVYPDARKLEDLTDAAAESMRYGSEVSAGLYRTPATGAVAFRVFPMDETLFGRFAGPRSNALIVDVESDDYVSTDVADLRSALDAAGSARGLG